MLVSKKRALLSSLFILGCVFQVNAKEVDVAILATSDVHGRMLPWDYGTDKADSSGSYAQISSFLKEYRSLHENVIVVDAGDIIQDNQIERFHNVQNHPAIAALNAMHYDIMVLGNHEFNFGMPIVDKVISEFKGQSLAANIYYKDSGKPYLPATTIIEKEGIKIGFIGATTPFVPEYENKTGYVNQMEFTMPIPEIKKQIANLKQQSVDAIVLVTHMGLDNENNKPGTGVADVANQLPEIDIIIAGHNHQNISEKVINNVVITEPHRYGTVVSVVDLKFDIDGNKKTLKAKKSQTLPVKTYPADSEIEKIYSPYHQQLREISNQVIGETDKDLVPQEIIHGIPAVYLQESGLTNLLNSVQIYYSGADVTAVLVDNKKAILNKGPIARKDIANNYQYTAGETSIFEVTGKDLKDYMEWSAAYFAQVQPTDKNYQYDSVRGASKYMTYDMFGGVKYIIDLSEPVGNRIKNLTLLNGKVITDDMKLKLGMNAYRYEMLVKKGGPLEGRRVEPIWNSRTALGDEEGTIRNMTIKYITDVKKGKITDESNNNWKVIGIDPK
ncbi:bifunctional metallophosphatase/5'-nucleotidase [Gilliamella sp. B14384H2]|uniref:bifunctional metallophosphatase/5'-nucleotidase n=1 Tax=unclassified Gilliamella TaxID=2685620 RepID=UPI0018DB3CE9|nr:MULTISPECIES: bifunctional UDP-sugar hydrolase/5'-nucleotidase [unclassified Gilliamella]MBI0038153.1 bifunctional metallophosphatase/5'-nucleotidase [Gilliamella sp. B14384G10]MBI0040148.1 bifunctional metallophosphatase/5'-nucleotidase [Gilliamella sp. B14384G7]MBI0051988.1 bifunctional metallophosphatase/5'-nucleotidase [Gilliamella sp. B14384G13]MBI0054440.1 bifunctional metallophosphatase/5'-nucleotidase [Gilliamella sp. B14384H2]